MKGIYCLKINNKVYIGKDAAIDKSKRLKEHLLMLKKDIHYNTYLQNAYNKYQNYDYEVIFQTDCFSLDDLSNLEQFYINKYNSYHNGYNLTLGGEGGLGIVIDEKGRRLRSERSIGELNPQSKLTNNQFFEIVELFKSGKTNSEIASIYNLHDRYVSLIRHKRRFKKLWDTVDGYEPVKSNGQLRNLTYQQFVLIVDMLENGETNAEIERRFNLASGTGSRIRHKKLYKRFWNQFLQNNQ